MASEDPHDSVGFDEWSEDDSERGKKLNFRTAETAEEKSKQAWKEILNPPFTAAVLGRPRTGKSVLSHRLVEVFSEEGYNPYVAGFREERMRSLPKEYEHLDICQVIDEADSYYEAIVDQWPKNSVVLINTTHVELKAGKRKENVREFYELVVRTARENSSIIILDVGTTHHLTESTVAEIDVFLCRYPRRGQEEYERGVAKTVVSEAREALDDYTTVEETDELREKDLDDEVVRRVYISAPEFNKVYPHKISLPSYWSDDISRQYTDIDEETDKMIEPDDVLEALKKATANSDGEWVSKTDIDEILGEDGDFYRAVASDYLDSFEERGLCMAFESENEIRYRLTELGKKHLMNSPGDAVTSGKDTHKKLIYTMVDRFDQTGFNTSVVTQRNGEQMPDAVAKVPLDMETNSKLLMDAHINRLEREYPEVAAVTDGRDVNLEVETNPGNTTQVLTNLKKALKNNRLCFFGVTENEDTGNRSHHAEKLAKKLLQPSGKIKQKNGEVRYYMSSQPIKKNGKIAVRPAEEAESTQWWQTPERQYELRDAKTGDVICSLDSITDFDEFPAEKFPFILNKHTSKNRVSIERALDGGKYRRVEEYDDINDALNDDWKIIRRPFVLEQYIPQETTLDDWWKIIYIPLDGDGPLLEYNPYITEEGNVSGEFRPLFEKTKTDYFLPDKPIYSEFFSRNTATHWVLYLLAVMQEEEMIPTPVTTTEMYEYISDGKCGAFNSSLHPNPFPTQNSLSSDLSKIPSELIQRVKSARSPSGYAYQLTEMGEKIVADAGIPDKLPDRNVFDDREVKPLFDPRTKQQVEAICDICDRPTGSLASHIRHHMDSSTHRYETPISPNTMNHWTLYTLNKYYDMVDRSVSCNDLYQFTDGFEALGDTTDISATLGNLYKSGLVQREKVDGTKKYQYKPTESGRVYIQAMGSPDDYPERNVQYDIPASRWTRPVEELFL